MQHLKSKLSSLDNPQDTSYTIEIRKIIFNDTESKIPDDYLEIIDDDKNRKTLRFGAFYCLFTQYRRFEQRYFLFELIDKYIKLFNEEEYKYLCEIIWSQYYKFKFIDAANKDLYNQAIKHAKKAIDYYATNSDNIGCFNNYADIVLDSLIYKNIVSEEDVSNAIQYVDRSIYIQEIERRLYPNPQYYYRKARLLVIQKKYDEAKKMIALAISYSKPDDKDSLIRIASYHNMQLEIKTDETLNLIDSNVAVSMEQYQNIKAQLEQQQVRYIEILGFFASTIALLTGSISIVLNFSDFNAACGLIIVLSGCLVMAYAILKILFSEKVGIARMIAICLIVIIVIAFGYLIGNKVLFSHMIT